MLLSSSSFHCHVQLSRWIIFHSTCSSLPLFLFCVRCLATFPFARNFNNNSLSARTQRSRTKLTKTKPNKRKNHLLWLLSEFKAMNPINVIIVFHFEINSQYMYIIFMRCSESVRVCSLFLKQNDIADDFSASS